MGLQLLQWKGCKVCGCEAAASTCGYQLRSGNMEFPTFAIYIYQTVYSIHTIFHTVVQASRAAGNPQCHSDYRAAPQ